jgi:hypothetical protein
MTDPAAIAEPVLPAPPGRARQPGGQIVLPDNIIRLDAADWLVTASRPETARSPSGKADYRWAREQAENG